jgi:hypothetical protein
MVSKKGMEMSISVIIVAVLALVILVVLVAIFTGRISVFEKGLSKEAQTELIKMKIQYGDCKPPLSAETTFSTEFSQATDDAGKDAARTGFMGVISQCKNLPEKSACESSGCRWS